MTTLLTYIKKGKYDSCLFKIERLNKEDKNMLNIKIFNDKQLVYIKRSQIVPQKLKLVQNRAYELSDIKCRQWNNYTVKTYHLTQTFETLSFKNEPKCLL